MSRATHVKPRPIIDTEDDLDELDDVLEQFNQAPCVPPVAVPDTSLVTPPPPPPSAVTATAASSPFVPLDPNPPGSRPRTNTRVDRPPQSVPGSGAPLEDMKEEDEDESALTEAFSRELAENMESLVRELDSATLQQAGSGAAMSEEQEKILQATWDALLSKAGAGNDSNDAPTPGATGRPSTASADQPSEPTEFQQKIKAMVDKLHADEPNFQAPADTADANPESLEALLRAMNDVGLGGEGGDEAELATMFETMITSILSKDILYEPLKELNDKMPEYLTTHPDIPAADKQRYDSQLGCVRKILAIFDDPKYNDDKPDKQIADLMAQMQEYGSPPLELLGDLPDGINGFEDKCVLS